MYSLSILFFSLPLYFSHVFSPIGVTIWESYSFERYKVYLFLILLVVAYIEWLIRYPQRIWNIVRKYAHIIALLFVIPIASAFYFATPLDLDWLMGSHEKHHGYLFYTGVISLIILLMANPREHLRHYITWSIASAILVAVIAIWEHIWGILDIYDRSEMISAYPGRSSSTLGNPNYVAGYLIAFIPIVLVNISNIQSALSMNKVIATLLSSTIVSCVIIAIAVTGSHIAILLLGILILWYSVHYVLHRYTIEKQIIIFATVVSILILWLLSLLDPMKLLSLQSRFVLMQESIKIMFVHPISLLVGFGPDALLTQFSLSRSTLVSAYFPQNMLIDSSHNIFIDILFQYGAFPVFLLIRFLFIAWNKLTTPIGLSISLLLGFLTFNVFVVSHLIILILLLVFICKS